MSQFGVELFELMINPLILMEQPNLSQVLMTLQTSSSDSIFFLPYSINFICLRRSDFGLHKNKQQKDPCMKTFSWSHLERVITLCIDISLFSFFNSCSPMIDTVFLDKALVLARLGVDCYYYSSTRSFYAKSLSFLSCFCLSQPLFMTNRPLC